MSNGALHKVIEFKRDIIKDFLAQCTKEQVNLFNRLYGSVDTIPENKMDWAIEQCERTVENNKTKKE